ncbi:hypothetical protein POUND7_003014 [Theobroma cacao]
MSGSGKKTRGRQKIEMKKIENEDDRLITFSKRRSGIYKKASELATMCGAEIAFIVFSPAGKPFSYGHPSVESVVNRYLNQNPLPNDNTHPLVEAHRKVRINTLAQQHNELVTQLDAEKERGKMLDQLTRGKETKGWWEAPIDQLNQQELEKLYLSFAELRTSLHSKMKEKSAEATSSQLAPMDPAQLTTPFPANPFPTNLNEQVPAQLNAPFPTNPFPTNLNEQVPAQLNAPFPTNPFPTNLNVQVPAQLTTPFPTNPFPTNLNEQVPGFFPPGFGPGRQ